MKLYKSFALVPSFVAASLFLTGCQTANRDVYQQAFDHGGGKTKPREQTLNDYNFADLQPGERPNSSSMEAGVWMSMDKAEKQYATAGNRITDPALTQYVESIVCKVADKHCSDIRVYLLQVPLFNAFMAPNGTMVIFSGFLLRARNEAQLAAVIGHEISHYLRRHSAQRIKDVVDTTNALAFVQLAGAASGARGVGDIAQLAALGSIQAFSRDNEREADGFGLALMVRAGYAPNEAADIWKRVMRERNANKAKSRPDLFTSTHPPSEERNQVLQDLAGSVAPDDAMTTNEDAYQAALRPLRADFLRDEVSKRQYDETLVLLEMLLEDGHSTSELNFFRGELYRLRGNKGDKELAMAAYHEAASQDSPPADLYRSLGLILLRDGKTGEADKNFQKYLDLAPNAPDRSLVRSMIKGG